VKGASPAVSATGAPIAGATRLHEFFDRRLAQAPAAPFIHTEEASFTLAELDDMVRRLQAELQSLGVGPGERVMVLAENCPEHVALILACSRIGAWSCGVNARMSAGEVAQFMRTAEPAVVYFTSTVSNPAAQHAQALQAVDSILHGLQRTSRLPSRPQESPLRDEVAALIFTSGTTGHPKAVMVSHAGLVHFGRVSTSARALGPADRVYAALPMTHIFGLGTVLAASTCAGAQLLMRASFDPADLLDALRQRGLSQLLGPPALYARFLAWLDEQGIAQPECPQLNYLYTGAAPLDLTLKQAVEARFGGLPLHYGYGLSEYAGSVHIVALGQKRADTSSGLSAPGGRVRIVDAAGTDLPTGERGEIWISGTGLTPGYFRDPQATMAVMKPGGWYASGDIGYLDAEGALFVVGRLKELIIRSGFNVYPAEIENALCQFPGIRRAAVVGLKETDGNEQVIAFVETQSGELAERASLLAHLEQNLAPYKRPAHIIAITQLPMTLSGKVLKRELVQIAQARFAPAGAVD
jgi:malonyl-CoA/methylmalonyl-CoA synthetase